MLSGQVGSLIENCNLQSHNLHKRALLHKWIANIGGFLVILSSVCAGGIMAYSNDPNNPYAIGSTFSAALIKGLMIFCSPDRRAVVLERISIEVGRVARKLRKLDTQDPDVEQVKKVLDRAYDRLDDLKLNQFAWDATKIIDNVYASQQSYSQDAELYSQDEISDVV